MGAWYVGAGRRGSTSTGGLGPGGDELWRHIALRLAEGSQPAYPRVLAHAEVLLVVIGKLETKELYAGKGTKATLISASAARKLLDIR